jgi:cytochrome c peroxidase
MEEPEYDDGSFGPIFVRLAWHASGTYDKVLKDGGSNGGTMRFEPEASFEANYGLEIARDELELVKNLYEEVSYGDIWALASIAAIQQMVCLRHLKRLKL